MLRASAINNPKDELDHLHYMKQMQIEEWTVWLPISECFVESGDSDNALETLFVAVGVLATLNLDFATTEVAHKGLDFA
ncbi:hypothetical protein Tco_0056696, partial [Tanacetum coccineum]